MKRKMVYIPTRPSSRGGSSTMVVPWDYIEEFIEEMHKAGILPTLMGDEVPSLDFVQLDEEVVIFPLQVEE